MHNEHIGGKFLNILVSPNKHRLARTLKYINIIHKGSLNMLIIKALLYENKLKLVTN